MNENVTLNFEKSEGFSNCYQLGKSKYNFIIICNSFYIFFRLQLPQNEGN